MIISPYGRSYPPMARSHPSHGPFASPRFTAWPSDALEAVATKFLSELPDTAADTRACIMAMCKEFHQDMTHLSEQYRWGAKVAVRWRQYNRGCGAGGLMHAVVVDGQGRWMVCEDKGRSHSGLCV